LKIGIVSEYYYPYVGGISEHVHFTYKYLKEWGANVKIITPLMKDLKYHAEYSSDWAGEEDIIRIGLSKPFYYNGGFVRFTWPVGLSKNLKRVFESEKFDLIHVHAPLVPILPVLAVKHSICPVVGTFHTLFKKSLCYTITKSYFQNILDKIDTCVAVSPLAAEAILKYFDVNFQIIPNGIDTELYKPENPPIDELMSDGVKNILFIGRFDPHNGLPVLLNAFTLVKRRYRNCRLVIVGDGPLAPQYKKMVPAEIKQSVLFVGTQHKLKPNYLASADILCQPATLHSFSLVCLEAMASGVPVICSDLKAFRWLFEEDGVFVPPCDSEKLSESILNLLEDPYKRMVLGERLRKRSLNFSWDKIISQIINIYNKTLNVREDYMFIPDYQVNYDFSKFGIDREDRPCYQNPLF